MLYDFVICPDDITPYMMKGYEAEVKRVSKEEYLTKGLPHITDFFGVEYRGAPIGFVIFHGHWIHVAIDKKHHKRWFNKKTSSIIRYGLLLHGKLNTVIHKDDVDVMIFAKRLGFKEKNRTEEGHPSFELQPEDFIFGV